jgi:hypothetical protein
MIRRHGTVAIAPLLAGALCIGLALPAHAQKSLREYAQPALNDLTASVAVVTKNPTELNKIGKGYADAYTLDDQQISFKDPGKVRFQGKRGLLHINRVTNASRQLFEVTGVAFLKHRKVEDLNDSPGKADSIVDLGVLTPAFVESVESHWLRREERDGKMLQVFQFWHKIDPAAKHTLWIDPSTKTVVEHVVYHRDPKKIGFRKRFVFSDVKQVSGVFVPSKVSLYNGENKLAGVMRYDGIRVNSGLADKLFVF